MTSWMGTGRFGGGVTYVIEDTFNRADSTAGLGTRSDGGSWTAFSGTGAIASNKAAYNTSTFVSYEVYADAGHVATTITTTMELGVGTFPFIKVRQSGVNAIKIFVFSGGVAFYDSDPNTSLGGDATAISTGAPHAVQVVVTSGAVAVTVDGSLRATLTSNLYNTNTEVGFGIYGSGDTFDDFRAT